MKADQVSQGSVRYLVPSGSMFDVTLPRFSVGDNNVIFRFEDQPDGVVLRISRATYEKLGQPESLDVEVKLP